MRETTTLNRRLIAPLAEFFRLESAGGMILVAAAAAALIADNSPLSPLYDALLATPARISVGALAIDKPLLLWINDGLMAVFFLLVGLELKREFLDGELSRPGQVALPAAAAAGGLLVPALIYAALNWSDATALQGWAIPSATDIAFSLGVLALLGARVPLALKVLLTTIAVADDLGAIVIIAVFYTAQLSLASLTVAAAALAALALLNRAGVTRVAAYVLVGLVLWVAVLKSGVHATLAGVALGLAVPPKAKDEEGHSPLRHLEHALHPWVAFGVLPAFAFANAGVSLAGLPLASLAEPVTLGIAAGLFVGKQVGIFGAIWLMVRLGLARLPEGMGWAAAYGVALLCGIGFTMSLFIGTLAFDDATRAAQLRLGVILGSLASAGGGYLVLRAALPARAA